MIVIVDYGMGNVRSLRNAFDFLGYEATISRDIDDLEAAERIVLPGVGAFRDAVGAIRDLGLEAPLKHYAIEVKKPILGVCLGMQLIAKTSMEYGRHKGLGWLDAAVIPLKKSRVDKVPNVGWSNVEVTGSEWMFEGLPENPDFYFVHSFHMVCANKSDIAATTTHNGEIVAAVAHNNIVATQFHPEKSQDNGLKVLSNWLERKF